MLRHSKGEGGVVKNTKEFPPPQKSILCKMLRQYNTSFWSSTLVEDRTSNDMLSYIIIVFSSIINSLPSLCHIVNFAFTPTQFMTLYSKLTSWPFIEYQIKKIWVSCKTRFPQQFNTLQQYEAHNHAIQKNSSNFSFGK